MIKIISCMWNAEKDIEACIFSVKSQTHKDFIMFLVDDVSTDDTINKAKLAIADDPRFLIISNSSKQFKIKNMQKILDDKSLIDDDDIIVELDGDDKLASDNVLEKIHSKYSNNPELWLTNGSFVFKNGAVGFSGRVNYLEARSAPFQFSHLRTWKAHLWRRINPQDFLDSFGNTFSSAPDLAYSFPMVEMSGELHYEFISDILYIYNNESPFNEFKDESAGGGRFDQMRCEVEIRNKTRYEPT